MENEDLLEDIEDGGRFAQKHFALALKLICIHLAIAQGEMAQRGSSIQICIQSSGSSDESMYYSSISAVACFELISQKIFYMNQVVNPFTAYRTLNAQMDLVIPAFSRIRNFS